MLADQFTLFYESLSTPGLVPFFILACVILCVYGFFYEYERGKLAEAFLRSLVAFGAWALAVVIPLLGALLGEFCIMASNKFL